MDRSGRALIRHEPEDKDHLRERFYNPLAQRRASVVHDLLGRGVPRAPVAAIPGRRLPPR